LKPISASGVKVSATIDAATTNSADRARREEALAGDQQHDRGETERENGRTGVRKLTRRGWRAARRNGRRRP
jgi:hypothetical protein